LKNLRTASSAGRAAGQQEDQERERARRMVRRIDQLESSIQQFRIDAQRFFAGDLPQPPDPLRERIQSQLRQLRGANLKGAAVDFRLTQLEARFNSHLDLFGRRLREQEMGGGRRVTADEPSHDPERGVVIGAQADRSATEALYKGLYLRSGTRNPKMDLERFQSYLDRQAQAIRAKTGCDEIQFRVADQDGKLKLKAKPIRRRS
jgi:hypothetical protein